MATGRVAGQSRRRTSLFPAVPPRSFGTVPGTRLQLCLKRLLSPLQPGDVVEALHCHRLRSRCISHSRSTVHGGSRDAARRPTARHGVSCEAVTLRDHFFCMGKERRRTHRPKAPFRLWQKA
ncbi:unnamed protein product [Ixodes pacificus]